MSYPSNTESLAIRYAPYIDELHEFFKSSGLRFGSREDIQILADRLSTQGNMHDEMASMVRSIVYREHKAIPRTELLELIVVAVGGPQIDQSAQQVHEPIRQLLAFIGEVMRSLRRSSFLEDPATDTEVELLSSGASAVDLDDNIALSSAIVSSTFRSGELNAEDVEDWPIDPEPSHGTSVVETYSYHLSIASSFREAEPLRKSKDFPTSTNGPTVPPGSVLTVARSAPTKPSFSRNFWLPGTFLSVVVLGMGLLWYHQSSVRMAQSRQENQTARTSSKTDVPTASAVSPDPSVLRNGQAPISSPAQSKIVPRAGTSQVEQASVSPETTGIMGPTKVASEAPVASAPKSIPPSSPNATGSQHALPQRASRATPRPTGTGLPALPVPLSASSSTSQNSFLVSSGVMSGNLISSPAPSYPKMANMAGIEGQVILQAVVSRNGTVVAAHALDGHHLLRGAAAKAVKRWRYKPYVVNGKATDVATIVIVNFHLPH